MTGSIVSTYVSLVRSMRDKQITKLYKETIPKEMYENIQTNFSIDLFTGDSFSQVATSRLTATGLTSSNVKATYGKVIDANKKDTHVSVLNQSMNGDFLYRSIKGESRPRIDSSGKAVPGCRTVNFNSDERYTNQGFEGDYWVIYATSDMQTIVVGSPIILFGYKLSSNFGVYVLTKDPETFWSNENSEARNEVMYYITGRSQFNPEKNGKKLCLDKKYTSWYNEPIATSLTYYPEKYSQDISLDDKKNNITPEPFKDNREIW
jgi:lipocalin